MKKLENMTEPELSALMRYMGNAIEFVAKKLDVEKPLFALLLFNDPKVSQYIGNCTRASMVEVFREAAERLEKRQDVERNT